MTLRKMPATQGRLVLLGAGPESVPVPTGYFVGGERSLLGSITGSPFDTARALNFSVLADVRPMIEVMPLEQAADAYQRMRSGDVKFRMVLTMQRLGS
ncbi:alcohol dehydrogenase [Caballeronia arvi]|uniref:Alcohol dehydrogenase n=1 Tax=Caballeronia arvi TaxID=1777135 RepID=A0A158KJ64_9BURK|nr:alcohol dehydrogenase [Caballeronia arvi]